MDSSPSASRMVQLLLAGPRGRRFLLEYALASELACNPVRTDEAFGQAAFYASHRMDPHKKSPRALFGWVGLDPGLPEATVDEVEQRLHILKLLDPTPQRLRQALADAVGNARYWQEPDGQDVLAAAPEMQHALQRVAKHVAASPLTAWWGTPVDICAQHTVQWQDTPSLSILDDVQATLLAARHQELTEEHVARRERDPDPTANWSGHWWSHPPAALTSSTRLLFDDSPAGLWFVEDSLGWEQASSVGLIVPEGVAVFEIQNATDWAALCARFPLEVTAQKRHDWYRTAGHTGRWVVPDWVQVAEHYDAVHLQVGAYLSAAGVAIPIDDSTGTASMIAGWNPDETYWLSSDIAYDQAHTPWVLVDVGTDVVWKRASPETS